MDVGGLVAIFLGVVLINNFVLAQFLGICPFLGVSRKIDMAFGMGCAVTFVMTISGVVTWLIVHGVLMPIGAALGDPEALAFLKYTAFIMVIAAMVQLVEMYLKKFFRPLYDAFGVYLPLITTNCAILGACLLIDMNDVYRASLLSSTVFAFGGGVGFALAITIMAGIREHLTFSDVPAPLRGAAITLLTACILSLAFMGFAGMGK